MQFGTNQLKNSPYKLNLFFLTSFLFTIQSVIAKQSYL